MEADQGHGLIGRRLQMRWEQDLQWGSGAVFDYSEGAGKKPVTHVRIVSSF